MLEYTSVSSTSMVHIPVLGHDVIDAAEADVVGPAVAADGPDGLLGEILTVLQDIGHIFGLLALLQGGDQGVGHGAGLSPSFQLLM